VLPFGDTAIWKICPSPSSMRRVSSPLPTSHQRRVLSSLPEISVLPRPRMSSQWFFPGQPQVLSNSKIEKQSNGRARSASLLGRHLLSIANGIAAVPGNSTSDHGRTCGPSAQSDFPVREGAFDSSPCLGHATRGSLARLQELCRGTCRRYARGVLTRAEARLDR